jgi:hypothetical protein
MLKQEIKSKKQEEVDKNRSPFLVNFFKKHPYKEYRNEQNRLVIEWKNLKLIQVLHNEEDKILYTTITKEYIDFASSNLNMSLHDKSKEFNHEELFKIETTHKNYDKFPMFFVYNKNNECLGICGYRNVDLLENNGKKYELQEISCRFPKLVKYNSIEIKRGVSTLLLFDYAERNNQKVFVNVWSMYRDVAFNYTNIIKNFHFQSKNIGNDVLKDTEFYSFNNI